MSGVGDTAELRGAGVEPTHHLPGVGRNLQDHLEIYMVQACTQPVSLLSDQGGLRMIKVLTLHHTLHYSTLHYSIIKLPYPCQVGVQWFLNRTGAASSSHLETGGFIRSGPGVPHPDIQFHFLPSQVL